MSNQPQNNNSANNKRIAKNTLMLYIRTFLTMVVTLYTSRVILHTLGVEDYGIYHVVGGIVAMIGILNNAMSTATQRCITYELGKGDGKKLALTFNSAMQIYILLCIIMFIICESFGVWFLNTHLVIPVNRMNAANIVFQFSIFACINSLLVNPYNACIVAHEHMSVYAYVSILDVLLKLAVAAILPIIPMDRLITYGVLILGCQITITMIYRIYCVRRFSECHLLSVIDKDSLNKMLSFTGWNLYGGIAVMGKTQGLNIILNMFFTPAINASRGIAVQINHAVSQFSHGFLTAFRPQITKYYAQGNLNEMNNLVYACTKYTYYLLFLISLPILLYTEQIINLWLGEIPDHVIPFTRLIILISIVDTLASPLMTIVQAVGRLKLYQIVISTLILLNVPISYIALKNECSPNIVFEISLCISILCIFSRVLIIHYLIDFSIGKYFRTYFRPALVTLCSIPIPYFLMKFSIGTTFVDFGIKILLCLFVTTLSIYIVGINSNERRIVMRYITKKIKK